MTERVGDDEAADFGQLCQGARPERDASAAPRELVAEVAQHVTAGMVAERHEKRAEKDLMPRTLQARAEARRGVNEDVGTTAGLQRDLESGK